MGPSTIYQQEPVSHWSAEERPGSTCTKHEVRGHIKTISPYAYLAASHWGLNERQVRAKHASQHSSGEVPTRDANLCSLISR
jgi:hypothetical protein